ncbi:hypothetical protein [Sinorhizobium glycinis]|uniref:hypothetical protein n=1 Tax=Sinorhizobium glycinis TaxID=1472378 RepID=UPI0013903761|nr:hypothetical protein [Sinorhizobium glycinis]
MKTFVALFFRVHFKITQRSADMQIMVAHTRLVQGDLRHRLEYMSRRDLHCLPEEFCFPKNAKPWRRFLTCSRGAQLRIDFFPLAKNMVSAWLMAFGAPEQRREARRLDFSSYSAASYQTHKLAVAL